MTTGIGPTPRYGFQDVAKQDGSGQTISAQDFQRVLQNPWRDDGTIIDPKAKLPFGAGKAAKREQEQAVENRDHGITKAEFLEKEFIDGNGRTLNLDEKNALFERINTDGDGTRLSSSEISTYFEKHAKDGVMDQQEWTGALQAPAPASTGSASPSPEQEIRALEDGVQQRKAVGKDKIDMDNVKIIINTGELPANILRNDVNAEGKPNGKN